MYKAYRKGLMVSGLLFAAVALVTFPSASAATTVVVTPSSPQGWMEGDMREGGEINYIADETSPYPNGALQLVTDDNTASKAQYMKEVTVDLADITSLGYHTKQNAGPAEAAPSYQLAVYLDESESSFTTLVYEPYWNGTVEPTVWQEWDAYAGDWWSSRTYDNGNGCVVAAGAGGPPFYNLADLQAACPDAQVIAFGVNVGTYNVGYDVETDGVWFNDSVYDFELDPEVEPGPVTKDDCKNGGWMTYSEPREFRNQGDCVSHIATQGRR